MKNLFTNGSRFRQILLISAIIISLYLSINIPESFAEPQTKPLAINLDEIGGDLQVVVTARPWD